MTSFFAAYDVLCEEGTATSVCKALDEVADLSIPGIVFNCNVFLETLFGMLGPDLFVFSCL